MASSPAKSNPWVARALTGTNLVLVLLIAYLAVKLVFLFMDRGGLQTPPTLFGQKATTNEARQQQMASVDASAIPLWNLFGREGVAPVAATPQSQDVDAPKTRLQLELQGVFVATDENNSSAIIAERAREAKLYHIGDKLPGNATLAGVLPDRVLLNTSGRTESLYFPDANAGGPVTPARSGAAGQAMQPGAMRPTSGRPNFGMPGGAPGGAADLAKTMREEIAGNPKQALADMGLELNNGKGYKVSASGNPMFAALGARPGDTILSVNGKTLGNPDADLAIMEELMGSAESATFEMERNNKRFSTQVPLR